jgi:hypothetical protein
MLADNTTCQQLVSGMSIKAGKLVAPALQVLLGGEFRNGSGRFQIK